MKYTNLHQVFAIHNIRSVLMDKRLYATIKSFYEMAPTPFKGSTYSLDVTDVRESTLEIITELLQPKYDMIIVSYRHMLDFMPMYHRGVFIFVYFDDFNDTANNMGVIDCEPDEKEKVTIPNFLAYTFLDACYEGSLYINTYHSVIFDDVHLSLAQQCYVRDKPRRFIQQTLQLVHKLLPVEPRVMIEIGSCRAELKHPLTDFNPMCCNDSHSTFFWATSPVFSVVTTVDINPECKRILEHAQATGQFVPASTHFSAVTDDGIAFLEKYTGPLVDFLFLDAWDVIHGTEYAENHLRAYFAIRATLSRECIISIDDTDIARHGKGRLLLPQLVQDGFFIVYQGRHTVLYRGKPENLLE